VQLITRNILTLCVTLLLSACGGGEKNTRASTTLILTPNAEPSTVSNTQPEPVSSTNTPPPVTTNDGEPFALADTVEFSDKQYFRVIAPTTCNQTNKNRFIYQVMHDSYLWANEVPELDYSATTYDSSEKMLTALKSSHDKFSFILDAQTAQSFFEEGKNNDFGMGLTVAPFDATTYVLVVTYVYPNSPAAKLGIKRSDMIQLVDGKAINKENFDEIVNILDNHSSANFTFLKQDNSTSSSLITKESYVIETVIHHEIFTNSNKKIGYMVFQTFVGNAIQNIDDVFKTFKAENVNELILDLRYNGGGEISIANHLASLIGGTNVAENTFNKIKFNERYAQYNETTKFEAVQENALNLNRVFVITTPATCSSSELVISSLRASANNVEVIQIGDTTCGKPYGFAGAGSFCDKALFAINMESQNGDGIGNYVNGFTPTCPAEDNYFKTFGDSSENSLAQALSYISTGKCISQQKAQQKAQQKSDLQLPKDGFKRVMSAY